MYLYTTILYTDTSILSNVPTNNDSNKSDFETNYKSQAVKVASLTVAETTYILDVDYSTFKSKIASPIVWSDIRYTDTNSSYKLYLVTGTLL